MGKRMHQLMTMLDCAKIIIFFLKILKGRRHYVKKRKHEKILQENLNYDFFLSSL